MLLELMYITNKPEVAKIAEASGVDWIFLDMEFIGKDARQGGLDTVQNHHTVKDVKNIKAAVKKAANTVKKEITAGAPSRSGKYAKSWRTKTVKESSTALEITVYSPTRYMLAHLLEHGHAKRNGGRVRAIPHIAPAEEAAEEQLMADIERGLKNG